VWLSLLDSPLAAASLWLKMAELYKELAKPHHSVFWKRKWVRLEALTVDSVSPINVQHLAHIRADQFPAGVLAVHIDRRKCILFRTGHLPLLMDLTLGLELLKTRLVLGLAFAEGKVYIMQVGKYKQYKNLLASVA
jgi:hypothetical protein